MGLQRYGREGRGGAEPACAAADVQAGRWRYRALQKLQFTGAGVGGVVRSENSREFCHRDIDFWRVGLAHPAVNCSFSVGAAALGANVAETTPVQGLCVKTIHFHNELRKSSKLPSQDFCPQNDRRYVLVSSQAKPSQLTGI